MFKKILPYFLAALLAVLIYVLGFYSGIRVFTSMKSTTMLQDRFIGSIETNVALNYLDKGEAEKARQYLLLYQDAAILSINGFAEYADKQSYETACNIIRRIATHRKENPSKYPAYTYVNEDDKSQNMRKEVAKILQSWDSCKSQK